MSDVRDRVTAILTRAEDPARYMYSSPILDVKWLVRRLLEALDIINKAKVQHRREMGHCRTCDCPWPCPTWLALSGEGSQQ